MTGPRSEKCLLGNTEAGGGAETLGAGEGWGGGEARGEGNLLSTRTGACNAMAERRDGGRTGRRRRRGGGEREVGCCCAGDLSRRRVCSVLGFEVVATRNQRVRPSRANSVRLRVT
jgi:hypothetical protein